VPVLAQIARRLAPPTSAARPPRRQARQRGAGAARLRELSRCSTSASPGHRDLARGERITSAGTNVGPRIMSPEPTVASRLTTAPTSRLGRARQQVLTAPCPSRPSPR
jgi:hypothetical protein